MSHFDERHTELMHGLFLALREAVRIGRTDHRNVEPLLKLAAVSDSGAVRRMLEQTLDKLKPDPVAAAIGARRAPTMQEVAKRLSECTPTQSR